MQGQLKIISLIWKQPDLQTLRKLVQRGEANRGSLMLSSDKDLQELVGSQSSLEAS
jgi:hypothetical protein